MLEPVRRTLSIAASPERVLAVIADFEDYPNRQREFESVTIVERDDQERATKVEMVTVAAGAKVGSAIAVNYFDDGLEWHLVSGDALTKNDARYVLRPNGDGTDLDLEMVLGLKLSIPDFMLKPVIAKGVWDALKGIKKAAEGH
ncbi:SRPBCC family protein [Nocardia asteroides]|uniref:SRPBCC family protein n=1 Tax=Nocardia asteroides TaxID=1824 RepID=UPI0037C8B5F7